MPIIARHVQMQGFDEAMRHIQAFDKAMVKPVLEEAALEGADIALEWVQRDMRAGKTGYYWPRLRSQSSSPGESPAVQEGDLFASLRTYNDSAPPNVGRAVFGAGNGLEDNHAEWMEFGTHNIAPRPYMRPAVDENKEEIKRAMHEVVWNAVRSIFR